jgi:hypothetical protein
VEAQVTSKRRERLRAAGEELDHAIQTDKAFRSGARRSDTPKAIRLLA